MSQSASAVNEALSSSRHAPVGAALHLLCYLAGVNPQRLADCPQDDRQATARTGLAVAASFLFSTTVVTGALCVALGHSAPLWGIFPLAMLMAGMVILIDHAIIQSHWFQSGLDQAQRQKTGLRLTRSGGFLRHFV